MLLYNISHKIFIKLYYKFPSLSKKQQNENEFKKRSVGVEEDSD